MVVLLSWHLESQVQQQLQKEECRQKWKESAMMGLVDGANNSVVAQYSHSVIRDSS